MAAQEAVEAIFRTAKEHDAIELVRLLDADPALLEATTFWDHRTLLYDAAERGDAELVRVLLARGADVNTVTGAGWTPLYTAASCGHIEVVSLLLSGGADLSKRSTTGQWTALMAAAGSGHYSVTRLLLQRGEGLQERDEEGRTALHWACIFKHTELCRALLLAGADHASANEGGFTPRDIAHMGGNNPCMTVFQWWEGELERAYALARARRVHEDIISQQQVPGGMGPAYLRQRVQRHKRLPRVHLQGDSCNGGRSRRAAAKRSKVEMVDELSKEEVNAMLKYTIQDLAPELYIELMAGFHK